MAQNIVVILDFSFSHTSRSNQQQIQLALLQRYVTNQAPSHDPLPQPWLQPPYYQTWIIAVTFWFPTSAPSPTVYVLPSFQINRMKTKFIPCPLFLYHFSMTPISLRVKASVFTEATRSPVLSLAPGPSTPIALLFLQQATHMPSPGGSHLLLILSGLLLTESPQACSHVLAASPPISFTRVHLSPWEFHDLKNYTVSYFLILSTGHKTQEDRNFILSTTLSSAPTKCQAHSNYLMYISWTNKYWNQTDLHLNSSSDTD